MTRPIAIVFANLKGNIGDFAILHAMLLDIGTAFPDQPVHVYSHGFLPVDQARMAAFMREAPFFEHAGVTFAGARKPAAATSRLLRLFRLRQRYQARRIRSLAVKSTPKAARFSTYDAVYLAGGAQWTGVTTGVSMFATLRAIRAHTDRVFSYPFSVSPSLWKVNSRAGLREDLARIRSPLIARDSGSASALSELGLETVLGADCVFSLAEAAERIAPISERDPARILLVLTGQKPQVLSETLQALRGQTGPMALLTTCAPEDVPVLGPVAKAADVPLLAPLTWQETVAEMKASSMVITNRLHGFILASFAGVPVLPLAGRPKLEAVVRDAGLPLELPDLCKLDAGLIRSVQSRRAEIVEKIAGYRETMQGRLRSPVQAHDAGQL
ncbi:polysaccharide pyruvyl transferase family protein [uncultured Jannaschia sp.]|uniref:polysaccharide pyruvyl transferase family protein n=1 Tax=uncultured Jannaschia sp. TaxID=293347 RepID=UPI00260733ED|nr:polysaccharide pyruvyl transferase family protein [uncultured Jannaschia sp.]